MEFYYHEPRFNFTFFGRFLIRLLSYVTYGFLTAGSLSFIFFFYRDANWLFWLGVLLALFLGDRFLDFKKAEYAINEIKSGRANAADFLTPAAYASLEYAFERSRMVGGNIHLHLLNDFIGRQDIKEAFIRLDLNVNELSQKLDEYLKESQRKGRPERRPTIEKIGELVIAAHQEASAVKEKYIEPRNFLVVSAQNDENVKNLFALFGLKAGDLREALIFGRHRRAFLGMRRLPVNLGAFSYHQQKQLRKRIMNRAWTARPTYTLDRHGTDLTAMARAKRVGFLIGHREEYRQLIGALSRPAKPNALLVGEPGIGKTTLVEHLAFQITKDEVPKTLFDKRLIVLELGSLVASASPDEVAGRLKNIIDEILIAGNVILYIPDIDNLVKTSGAGFLSAADMLLPHIKEGSFPVIGATYPREFKQYIEPQSDFASAFEIVRVEEISEDEATRLLVYDSLILESQYKVFITFNAVRQSVYLARRYFRAKPLPSSADDLLKEALGEAVNRRQKALTPDLVTEVAERRSKIPIQKAGEAETEKLLNLEEKIHERLINQEEAVRAVSNSLREYRSGLSRRGGPIASFLFVGPTGVGKTELSKALAAIQFGSEDLMVRFDMTEYQDKQSIFRFIGSPDGETVGMLTDAIQARPYSLILLDEFEKAHRDILNLFLQVFDDGRLTDNLGRVIDFQNTLIIATSNAHSNFIKEEIDKGRPMNAINEDLKKKLTEYFRPELLNRFSDIIAFRSLKLEEIVEIARLHLESFGKMLQETQGIEIRFDETAVKKIAELGFDPSFGARPLRKVISEKIRSAAAEKLLRKEIGRGNAINIALENDQFEFKIEK